MKGRNKAREISRREFMGGAVSAVAAFTIVPRHVLGGPGHTPPSEKLNVAGVGVGGMGVGNGSLPPGSTLMHASSVIIRIKIDAEAKRERAVIVAKEIAVFASPTSDATLEFRVHEGTRVIAEKSRSNWVKIRLPGGLDGWVDSAAIERI